jgi:DNA-directed RNA polymerase subunit beta'
VFDAQAKDDRNRFRLEEKDVSPLITMGKTYHLFQVVERRPEIPFDIINKVMDKGSLRGLVDYVYRNLGAKATVILADRLKDIGYKYSTKGGLSISIDAMIIPEKKGTILNRQINRSSKSAASTRKALSPRVRNTTRWSTSGPKPLTMWPMR